MWDYLEPLASLLESDFTVVRFEQRGCGRSTGDGPFTIAQATDDLDQLRAASGVESWGVVGHSWGAELALRYAARYPSRTTAVVYIAGIGAGEGYHAGYEAERDRRLGGDLGRWEELRTRARTAAEEREWCLLQWRPDFAPGPRAADHAAALWATRPDGVAVNSQANRELWKDRETEDLLVLACDTAVPVTMLLGSDDPRPWSATDSLFASLTSVQRVVLDGAGHAPWVERPDEARSVMVQGLTASA
ncbi:MAG: alpha/beta hydrolase [Pseudonocardiales bacterium]|nr:alpha/beta hydrolase [Pseudonocardiales bacterium]